MEIVENKKSQQLYNELIGILFSDLDRIMNPLQNPCKNRCSKNLPNFVDRIVNLLLMDPFRHETNLTI
ncbi:hypothetical protein [Salinimicrobium sp. WS361]|uniref:hypothetical protein n=1 Tax=Salinimicrobium sp. WS361 TaxID=3425123 RepID=UPI003D6EF8AC